jgi:glycosyltransferase involved in cell wall biosynthesis
MLNKMILNRKYKLLIATILICLIYLVIHYFKNNITSPFYKYYSSFFDYDVTIYGDVNPQDGIGNQAIEAFELLKKDANVQILTYNTSNKNELSQELKDHILGYGAYGKVLLYEGVLLGKGDIKPINKIKYRTAKNRDEQIWIAYSMFESSKITDFMVQSINNEFDMVVLPDKWLIDVYKNSGVTKPIFVVPLSIDYNDLINKPFKTDRNAAFTFGNFSSLIDRKNQVKLLAAFKIVNKLYPDTHLILNSRYSTGKSKKRLLAFLDANKINNVTIGYKSLSEADYKKTLEKIDAFVYPSLGEGFSIQPREAMAMGIPSIITDNSAQSTICESGLVECVKADIKIPACYDGWFGGCIGTYSDCTVEDLANSMIKVYNNYKYYLSKAPAMREWAMQYTIDNLRKKYVNMVKPKRIILGDRNEITDDYLMTNSEELYNKFIRINKN